MKIGWPEKRSGGVNAASEFDLLRGHFFKSCHGMTKNRDGGGEVVGEFRGAHEGSGRAVGFGDGCDLGIIGRDDDGIKAAGLERGLDGPSDHRLSAEGENVFARDALAASAGWDDGEAHGERLRGF